MNAEGAGLAQRLDGGNVMVAADLVGRRRQKQSLGYESFEHHSAGCSPVPKSAIYRGLGWLPTGGRPTLFLAISASLVSKS
jgi:hypothetical protein